MCDASACTARAGFASKAVNIMRTMPYERSDDERDDVTVTDMISELLVVSVMYGTKQIDKRST